MKKKYKRFIGALSLLLALTISGCDDYQFSSSTSKEQSSSQTSETSTSTSHSHSGSGHSSSTSGGHDESITSGTEEHTHQPGKEVEENRVEPTCTENGGYDLVTYCAICGMELYHEHIVLEALGHDIEYHQGKPATCTEDGYAPYETCSRCDYTTYMPIKAEGHHPGPGKETERVEPTCTEEGYYVITSFCEVCNEAVESTRHIIPALGHEYVYHEGKEATCTEDGYEDYETCTRCDYTSYEKIDATGHTPGEPVEENRIEATCTEPGSYELVTYCDVCDAELNRVEMVIPALNHKEYTEVKKNIVPATCTEPGSYDLFRYCTLCGEKLSQEHVDVPKLGHNMVHHHGKESTCSEHGYKDYYSCSRCDYTEQDLLPLLDHVEGETKIENIVAPTDTTDGTYDEVTYCSECHEELTRVTKTIGNSEHIHLTENSAEIFEQEYYRFYVDNESPEVKWSVSDEEILTINQKGKLASYGFGEAIIFATAEDGEYATAYLNVKEDFITLSTIKDKYFAKDNFVIHVDTCSRDDHSLITWTTTDETIVTVDNDGNCHAFKAGTATIRATLPSGKYAEKKFDIGALTVTLDPTSCKLAVNESITLKVEESNPGGYQNWSSSNTSIATVNSNGVVTGKAIGKCTITVSTYCGTATCTVTVAKKVVNLTTNNYSNYLTISISSSSTPGGTDWGYYHVYVRAALKSNYAVESAITLYVGASITKGSKVLIQNGYIGLSTSETSDYVKLNYYYEDTNEKGWAEEWWLNSISGSISY